MFLNFTVDIASPMVILIPYICISLFAKNFHIKSSGDGTNIIFSHAADEKTGALNKLVSKITNSRLGI